MRSCRAAVASLLVLLASNSVAAQESVEFTDGPVANSNRVVGMGGAFVGISEGADGQRINPASFGTRYTFSRNDFFDWDFAFYSHAIPGEDGSFDLSGPAGGVEDASVIGFGLDMKIGIFGTGFHVYGRDYVVRTTAENDTGEEVPIAYNISTDLGIFGFSWALPWIDTTVGVAPIVGVFSINDASAQTLAQISGAGGHFGALWAPTNREWRVGASYRTAIAGFDVDRAPAGTLGRQPPESLQVPAELRLGGSYMFGKRTYNPPRHYGYPEHFGDGGPDTVERSYVLVSADLVVTGSTDDAVGVQSFAAGTPLPSGEQASIGAHAGAEWEFFPNWMRLRGGSYWEPSRIDSIDGRIHGTAGFDVKVPIYWDFKIQIAADFARDYKNIGFGFGFWH